MRHTKLQSFDFGSAVVSASWPVFSDFVSSIVFHRQSKNIAQSKQEPTPARVAKIEALLTAGILKLIVARVSSNGPYHAEDAIIRGLRPERPRY